jgi:hypothetical protein
MLTVYELYEYGVWGIVLVIHGGIIPIQANAPPTLE